MSVARLRYLLLAALFALASTSSADVANAGRARSAKPTKSRSAAAKGRAKKAPKPLSKAEKAKLAQKAKAARIAAKRKYARVDRFAGTIGSLRGAVTSQLRKPELTQETAVAAMVRIMDKGYLRVGSERNATRAEKPSFGAASLRKRHVKIRGNRVTLTFMGKSGIPWKKTITDKSLANALELFMKTPGDRLFQVEEPDGTWSAVTARHVRKFMEPFGALPKDMRTFHANRIFSETLAKQPEPTTKAEVERNIKVAVKAGSTALNHTPAIYQKSYLNPALPADYRAKGISGRGPPKRQR